jgi:hypothetical protein
VSQNCFRRRTSPAPRRSWDESFPWASLNSDLSFDTFSSIVGGFAPNGNEPPP